ncbi:hypothetical protein Hanom_Chr04g00298211 [Helianthus anomalus]
MHRGESINNLYTLLLIFFLPINMVMIGKLLRFGRRQLHTIISRDIIKPANPNP